MNDNGLMVLMWRLLRGKKIQRLSGLKYLKRLLAKLKGEGTAEIFWVLPTERAQEKLVDWSHREAFAVKIDNCYVAPHYGFEIEDRHLLMLIQGRRPAHVLIAVGARPQEKLGYYLRENLSYRPAIHCTGAALGFITGDKIRIPAGPIAFIPAGLGDYLRSHTSSCRDSGGRVLVLADLEVW